MTQPRLWGNAGVAEWYTRATQNRVSQGMGVRVSPPAQRIVCFIKDGIVSADDPVLHIFWGNPDDAV